MIIKLLLLSSMVMIAALVFRGKSSATKLAVKRMVACLFLAVGMSAVVFPAGVTRVANFVGVGRGTDLVLYLVTIAFLFVSIALYRRLADLENRFVILARRLAIGEALGGNQRDADRVGAPASEETA